MLAGGRPALHEIGGPQNTPIAIDVEVSTARERVEARLAALEKRQQLHLARTA